MGERALRVERTRLRVPSAEDEEQERGQEGYRAVVFSLYDSCFVFRVYCTTLRSQQDLFDV